MPTVYSGELSQGWIQKINRKRHSGEGYEGGFRPSFCRVNNLKGRPFDQ